MSADARPPRIQSWIARTLNRHHQPVFTVFIAVTVPTTIVAVTKLFKTTKSLLVLALVLNVAAMALFLGAELVVDILARPPVRAHRTRWNATIDEAVRAIGVESERQIPRSVPVGRLSWWLWRRGWTDPDPRKQQGIAEFLGIEPVRLLVALGYIDEGAATRLLRVDRMRDRASISSMLSWKHAVETAAEVSQLSGGGRLAGAVNAPEADAAGEDAAHAPYLTVVTPQARGRKHVEATFHEYVAFIPIKRSSDSGSPQLRNADGRTIRHAAERRVAPWWQHTAAWWEDSTDLVECAFDGILSGGAIKAAHVAIVPGLLASRVRNPPPERGGPRHIAILGDHHSGAPDVGALLARSMDYSFVVLSNLAVERFGKVPDAIAGRDEPAHAPSARTVHEMSLASELMGHPTAERPADNYIWSYNDRDAVVRQGLELADSAVDLIVCLRSNEALMRYNAGREYLGGKRRDPASSWDFDRLVEQRLGFRCLLDDIVQRRRNNGEKVLSVEVGVPKRLVAFGSSHPDADESCYDDDVDAFFDLYYQVAADVADWIRKQAW